MSFDTTLAGLGYIIDDVDGTATGSQYILYVQASSDYIEPSTTATWANLSWSKRFRSSKEAVNSDLEMLDHSGLYSNIRVTSTSGDDVTTEFVAADRVVPLQPTQRVFTNEEVAEYEESRDNGTLGTQYFTPSAPRVRLNQIWLWPVIRLQFILQAYDRNSSANINWDRAVVAVIMYNVGWLDSSEHSYVQHPNFAKTVAAAASLNEGLSLLVPS